jgi:transposase
VGRSDCEPLRSVIEHKLDQGLHARRIFQDLVEEHGFAGSYWSVMRFVRRLGKTRELPFRRLECEAGEEAQVDFGSGAPVVTSEGRRRKTHVFRIVLSHSRKAYSEAVFRQTTENFIRCIENAFHHFGGSVKTLVIDNLRAAVTKADWYEPELHPQLRSFCEHYGVVILPTRPQPTTTATARTRLSVRPTTQRLVAQQLRRARGPFAGTSGRTLGTQPRRTRCTACLPRATRPPARNARPHGGRSGRP